MRIRWIGCERRWWVGEYAKRFNEEMLEMHELERCEERINRRVVSGVVIDNRCECGRSEHEIGIKRGIEERFEEYVFKDSRSCGYSKGLEAETGERAARIRCMDE